MPLPPGLALLLPTGSATDFRAIQPAPPPGVPASRPGQRLAAQEHGRASRAGVALPGYSRIVVQVVGAGPLGLRVPDNQIGVHPGNDCTPDKP